MSPHRARPRPTWFEHRFLVIDFETTSPQVRAARPLSVAWIPLDAGRLRMRGAGYTLVRYNGPAPAATMPIHRLRPPELAAAPPPEQVAERLRAALAGRTLVAHGAWIEVAMLRRLGLRLRRRSLLDTVQLVRARDRRTGAHQRGDLSLSGAAERLGVPVHRPHHAFGDALTTAELFLVLASWFAGRGTRDLRDLARLGRVR